VTPTPLLVKEIKILILSTKIDNSLQGKQQIELVFCDQSFVRDRSNVEDEESVTP
jgi:hypothetical protein